MEEFKENTEALLSFLMDWSDMENTITRRMVIEAKEDGLDLNNIEGWSFSVETDGEHHTDGCVVEYDFNLNNGKESWNLSTRMSLMIGWNLNEGQTFIKN